MEVVITPIYQDGRFTAYTAAVLVNGYTAAVATADTPELAGVAAITAWREKQDEFDFLG